MSELKIIKKVVLTPKYPPLEEISDEEFMAKSIKLFAISQNISIEASYKLHKEKCYVVREIYWKKVREILKIEEVK